MANFRDIFGFLDPRVAVDPQPCPVWSFSKLSPLLGDPGFEGAVLSRGPSTGTPFCLKFSKECA